MQWRCRTRSVLRSSRDVPTYDYRCRDCGHEIEIIHSILEDGPDACDRCRGPLVRVLHPAGVIFRGSGFYVTDSRAARGEEASAGQASGGESKGGESKGGESKGGESTDSAPTKTEKKESAGSTGSGAPD